jgi:hypothetical protein
MSQSLGIIIGIAQDIDPKNFVVFCASLRENVKELNSEAVIFINSPVHKRNREIATRFTVKLIEYDTNKDFASEPHVSKYHPSTLRWKLIYNYFSEENRRNRYSRVIMIDVRDSYFQGDPFSMIFPAENAAISSSYFFVFQGVQSVKIADCGWNGGWVRDCFGAAALSEVGQHEIICSGISMGTMNVVYEYLKLMNDIISGKSEEATQKGFSGKFPTWS